MWAICKRIFGWAALVAICSVALFGESATSGSSPAWLRSVLAEIRAACRDPGTQWMVFACCAIYFITFSILGAKAETLKSEKLKREKGRLLPTNHTRRGSLETAFQRFSISGFQNLLSSPDLWLCALLLIAALSYAFNYDTASGSTQALVLMAGAAIGKGARLWVSWGQRGEHSTSNIQHRTTGEAASDRKSEFVNRNLTALETQNLKLGTLLAALLLLLAGASLWHPEWAMQFQYRGLSRWSGPWDNPNIFGLLMGTGVVLACGLLVASGRLPVAGSGGRKPRTSNLEPPTSNRERNAGVRNAVFALWLWSLILFACLACCAVGLLKSYSRGAWLGTALGLAVLVFQVLRLQLAGSKGRPLTPSLSPSEGERVPGGRVRGTLLCNSYVSWLSRNWLPFSILLASLLVLTYWQFRHTEFHPVRRAFSVGNQNDFSWRNRVAAWEGSLAMMADRPLTGFGWNKPERIYDQYYRQPKVSEGMAIQLNHYFILGMSLGVPALLCFAAYIGLSLTRSNSVPLLGGERGGFPNRKSDIVNLKWVCRGGAVVLLVGLWFDGGLFNLATASLFWVLLELGRITPSTLRSSATQDGARRVVELSAKETNHEPTGPF